MSSFIEYEYEKLENGSRQYDTVDYLLGNCETRSIKSAILN